MLVLNALVLLSVFSTHFFVVDAVCNCGCLECNKHLNVITPPLSPVQIILKGPGCCKKELGGFTIQHPIPKSNPVLNTYGYQVKQFNLQSPGCASGGAYNYVLQVPSCCNSRTYLQGLIAQPDRIVVNEPGDCAQNAQTPQSQINIQPISVLEDELEEEEQNIFVPVSNCQCRCQCGQSSQCSQCSQCNQCNKRYRRSASSIKRSKRQLNSGERSNLLQNILFGRDNAINKDSDFRYDSEIPEDEEEILLKPLNIDALVPETTAVYLLNTPIRILHHAKQLKDYVYPIIECLPRIFRTTNKYFFSFIKDLSRKRHRFVGNFISDWDLIKELEEPDYMPVYPKFKRRERRHSDLNPDYIIAHDDIEKISQSPQIVIDEKGNVYVEINDTKHLLGHTDKKEADVYKIKSFDDKVIKDQIPKVIQQIMKKISNISVKNDAKNHGKDFVIKEAVTKVLDKIDALIKLDTQDDVDMYEQVRKLVILKTNIARNWYNSLNSNQVNNIQYKIQLLKDLRQLQNIKQELFAQMVKRLKSSLLDFNIDEELDTLLQLDQLQNVIDKIVDELGAKIQLRSKFDLKAELNFIKELVSVKIFIAPNAEDVAKRVKDVRDKNLNAQIVILEGLKNILQKNNVDDVEKESGVIQQLKHLQERKMAIIEELDGLKLDQSAKILAIMKIQKQIDVFSADHVFCKNKTGAAKPKTSTTKVPNDHSSEEHEDEHDNEHLISNGYKVPTYKKDKLF